MELNLLEPILNNGTGAFLGFLIWRLAVKHIDRNTETLNNLCAILHKIEGKING